MAKYKKMTGQEKKARAEAKRRLQEMGAIPPDKPKLNRKKFIAEAKQEWEGREPGCVWGMYLMQAVSYMLGQREKMSARHSPEAVAAAKILKLAVRLREFESGLAEKGESAYKITDQYEYVKDILEA